MKDFLHSDHLHESFGGRIYSLKHFHKCKFVHQRTHEDGHSRENPSNHELLAVRGGDCRASKKMFRGLLPPYCSPTTRTSTCSFWWWTDLTSLSFIIFWGKRLCAGYLCFCVVMCGRMVRWYKNVNMFLGRYFQSMRCVYKGYQFVD